MVSVVVVSVSPTARKTIVELAMLQNKSTDVAESLLG